MLQQDPLKKIVFLAYIFNLFIGFFQSKDRTQIIHNGISTKEHPEEIKQDGTRRVKKNTKRQKIAQKI